MRWKPQPVRRRRRRRCELDADRPPDAPLQRPAGAPARTAANPEPTDAAMEGYSRTEDELFSSACLLNLTWESCYEQVGRGILLARC